MDTIKKLSIIDRDITEKVSVIKDFIIDSGLFDGNKFTLFLGLILNLVSLTELMIKEVPTEVEKDLIEILEKIPQMIQKDNKGCTNMH